MDYTAPLKSKKYPTIGVLLNAPRTSIVQTVSRMGPCKERDILDEHLYNTYYKTIKLSGSLTARIPHISNSICYREIMKRCFKNADILGRKTTTQLYDPPVSDSFKELLRDLHKISSSLCGSFLDYLIRRILSELRKQEFNDSRSNFGCYVKTIHAGKEYLECVDVTSHVCTNGLCRHVMQSAIPSKSGELWQCTLPKCLIGCYSRAKNTLIHTTSEVLLDIFHTSLFHTEFFGYAPKQEEVDAFYARLELAQDILLPPIQGICTRLLEGKTNVLLNPGLGNRGISADADLILDDMLIDIKCTDSGNKCIMEIFQLLGYVALFSINDQYSGNRINTIAIINILKGEINQYDVSDIQDYTAYLVILNSKNGSSDNTQLEEGTTCGNAEQHGVA